MDNPLHAGKRIELTEVRLHLAQDHASRYFNAAPSIGALFYLVALLVSYSGDRIWHDAIT